jgi:hypothetical protein
VGSAAASPPASVPTPLIQQTIAAQTKPVADPILRSQQNLRTYTPHGSKKHGRRFARGARSHDIFSEFFR